MFAQVALMNDRHVGDPGYKRPRYPEGMTVYSSDEDVQTPLILGTQTLFELVKMVANRSYGGPSGSPEFSSVFLTSSSIEVRDHRYSSLAEDCLMNPSGGSFETLWSYLVKANLVLGNITIIFPKATLRIGRDGDILLEAATRGKEAELLRNWLTPAVEHFGYIWLDRPPLEKLARNMIPYIADMAGSDSSE